MTKLFLIILFMHVNALYWTSHESTRKQSVTLSGCNNPKVVLDLSKIPANWMNENAGLTPAIKSGRIYVDLSSIPHANRAMWLFKNNGAIIFDESSVAIACMHTIPDIGLFSLGTVKSYKTFEEIEAILAAAGSPLINSCAQYVELSFDSNNIIEIKPYSDFDPAKHYYSMALFMAIRRSNTDGVTTQFIFHKATYQGAPIIVIEVVGTSNSYYDFAQYPIKL